MMSSDAELYTQTSAFQLKCFSLHAYSGIRLHLVTCGKYVPK